MNSFFTDFDKQCALRPAAIALVHDQCEISYSQLDSLSRQFALQLADRDLNAGDSVALMCERSIAVIVAMLGTLRAGCVFVPIDTAFPDERIDYMLQDAGVRCIVTDDAVIARLQLLAASSQIPVLTLGHLSNAIASLDEVGDSTAANQATAQDAPQSSEGTLTNDAWQTPATADRAYIMYTSGSTGQPKGVPISHGALACYCQADAQVYQLQPDDRTLQFATLSFDISIEEIFPPLTVGSTVVLRPTARSEAQIELSDIIEQYGITAVHLATGYWHEWVDLMMAANVLSPPSLRLMVVTGEKVSPEHYQRWQSLTQQTMLWANAYGPTETTVTATVFVPPPGWQGEALPIGMPIAGYTAHILDTQGHEVTAGETGELYIGGAALAEGYLNRLEQTARAFVANPFSQIEGARLYRTGDLARWLDDGNIEYAGRTDHQIKVGSYRIEPGEVENAINTCPGVSESLVCIVEHAGQRQLFAYVASADITLQAATVAAFLQTRLPQWMMPSRYCFMEQLPKTINGKIDRKALPDPLNGVAARSAGFVEPESDLERALCQIWSEVLGMPEVGSDDSFISLGGDSLMAVRAITAIQKQLDYTLSTRDFFFLDTVALLAGHIQGKQTTRRVPPPEPAFINSRGTQLYTLLQKPQAGQGNGRGILLVAPLGNEQRRTQRPFRSLMQNFSRQGYTVMRFDWTGTANSSGDAETLSDLQVWKDDIEHAARLLCAQVDTLDIVGFRTGALVAAEVSLENWPVNSRYYWDPVLSGEQWLSQMQALHTGILADTFRFLRPRKPSAKGSTMREFAGIRLHEKLCQSLSAQTLAASIEQNTWNHSAQLLIPPSMLIDERFSAVRSTGVDIHPLDEATDWLDPRATTHDMMITQGARTLADKLIQHSPYMATAKRQVG
ncbi:amino acid adenylation domain-containing protein [Granulosicoccus antarcticus]|uniref:Linear gramicidin synthase subunit D n=1 Tax=Granulosicoccus antarcticus IMCC3135 TaxID=1192854 RepID=A0A2Z2NK05_9GAMM|nr:amino acid adenylation domain-containing protein [Granulosicoccus antarcticus]ASJ71509.1 Linear gramicidin synthase subunit D [Granulosicoccus antarcticus IMCC3135]